MRASSIYWALFLALLAGTAGYWLAALVVSIGLFAAFQKDILSTSVLAEQWAQVIMQVVFWTTGLLAAWFIVLRRRLKRWKAADTREVVGFV